MPFGRGLVEGLPSDFLLQLLQGDGVIAFEALNFTVQRNHPTLLFSDLLAQFGLCGSEVLLTGSQFRLCSL